MTMKHRLIKYQIRLEILNFHEMKQMLIIPGIVLSATFIAFHLSEKAQVNDRMCGRLSRFLWYTVCIEYFSIKKSSFNDSFSYATTKKDRLYS